MTIIKTAASCDGIRYRIKGLIPAAGNSSSFVLEDHIPQVFRYVGAVEVFI